LEIARSFACSARRRDERLSPRGTARRAEPLKRRRGFFGCGMLVGLLVAVLVIAFFQADLFKPSSPPMQVMTELAAWNQAVGFVKARLENSEGFRFPIYSPAFVRQSSPGTWEVTVTVELLDEYGIRTGRKVFRVLEKWDEGAGWTLSELSVTP